jgi:tetratricopeptide (TPR) repeat protein
LYKLQIAFHRLGKRIAAEEASKLFQGRSATEESTRAAQRASFRSAADHVRLGRAYLEAGLPPQALREARTALADSANDSGALLLLAEAALSFHPPDLETAKRTFERVLRANSSHVAALLGMGEVFRLEGSAQRASELFRKTLELDPAQTRATLGLARLATAEGNFGSAAKELEALSRLNPDDPPVLRALAEVYAASPPPLARPREAVQLLDRTESLYGEGIEARIRALVLLGERQEALRLIEDNPFLGAAERAALEPLLTTARKEK